MRYFEEIKSAIKEHLDLLNSISLEDLNQTSRKKIENHINFSVEVNINVDKEDPQKLKEVIEYLEIEGRNFGWSFPENPKEELCEESFLILKSKMKKLIGRMTGNERLHYFGYFNEFENLLPNHKSARDKILMKLFMLS